METHGRRKEGKSLREKTVLTTATQDLQAKSEYQAPGIRLETRTKNFVLQIIVGS